MHSACGTDSFCRQPANWGFLTNSLAPPSNMCHHNVHTVNFETSKGDVMETTDTTRAKTSESGTDGESSRGTHGNGTRGTRRKLNDQQEREVTRLYAETETPVSEISKRFGIGESSVYRVAQRHGAALRGRTSTTDTASPGPAGATGRQTGGTGRGGRRGRRPAGSPAATSSSETRPASTPSTNGRRTGARRGAGTPPTNGRRSGATSTRATRVPRGTRGGAATSGGRQFRVSFTATRVFTASSMSDAIRQAEAAGATDITGIERSS